MDHSFYQDYKLITDTPAQLVTAIAKEGANIQIVIFGCTTFEFAWAFKQCIPFQHYRDVQGAQCKLVDTNFTGKSIEALHLSSIDMPRRGYHGIC
jgi:hypothetical protein